MLGNIREIVLSVLVFLIFMFGVMVIFINASEPKNLDVNNFVYQNDNFKQCANNYEELNVLANNVADNNFIYVDDSIIEQEYDKYNFTTECSTSFVQSSDEQIQEYAHDVLMYAQLIEGNQNVQLLDTVYSTSSSYSAYLGMPKEYLFFTMNEDKTSMVAYIVTPQLDGEVDINLVWLVEESTDLEMLKSYTKKILLKYNEKIKM